MRTQNELKPVKHMGDIHVFEIKITFIVSCKVHRFTSRDVTLENRVLEQRSHRLLVAVDECTE